MLLQNEAQLILLFQNNYTYGCVLFLWENRKWNWIWKFGSVWYIQNIFRSIFDLKKFKFFSNCEKSKFLQNRWTLLIIRWEENFLTIVIISILKYVIDQRNVISQLQNIFFSKFKRCSYSRIKWPQMNKKLFPYFCPFLSNMKCSPILSIL